VESKAVITRDEFAASQVAQVPETASTAIAAREKAATEARYVMAERHPRDTEAFRVAILKDCGRPGFAEVARYKKPVGGGTIEGPSIRFAEAALRCFGNVYAEQSIVYEDDIQRIIRVAVTDLERNISYPSEVVVKKTVERKQKREGMEVLGERKNTKGDTVYLIRATEDDIQNKQNALVSKALRNNGLRLIPGDIIEECMAAVLETQRNADKADPDSAKRKVIDAFANLGIGPTELSVFLGHNLDKIQPAELMELRAAHAALKDGEAYWSDLLAAKGIAGGAQMQQAVAAEKIAAIKEKLSTARKCRKCGAEGHDARNCPAGVPESVPEPTASTPQALGIVRHAESLENEDPMGSAQALECGGKFYKPNADKSAWVECGRSEAEVLA
jgi:hypothetical protein